MKTGMVLEGGAVRTIYSTGVCDALLTRSLMTDYVIGVSAGIAYGVSYVSRQPRRNLDIMVNYINDKRYMGMATCSAGTTGPTSVWSSSIPPFPTSSSPLTTTPLPPIPGRWRRW